MPLVDTPFAGFAFVATGARAYRTMPDRLAEIKNVLDFGADPTNVADSTSAIQAAVNWTSGPNRGTIYFPLGIYKVTAPITFNYDGNLSICFRGEIGSAIDANFAGYVFDRHLATPNNTGGGRLFEKLSITNGHAAGGCIRLGSTAGGAIRDCGFNAGLIAITTEDAVGQSSTNILIENCIFGGGAVSAGSHYIIIGGGGAIRGCNLPGAYTGVRAYGKGLFISGNRAERCGTSFLFGLDSGGNPVTTSFCLTATSAEGSWTAYDLAGPCEGFLIASSGALSHDAPNSGPVDNVLSGQYGIRVRADCAKAGVIQSTDLTGSYEVGGIVVEDATSRGDLVIRENTALNSGGGGASWVFPGNAYTARFENNSQQPTWTYSQRPTGGNVLEGDELNITDSNTATWGATVAGGGSNHILMRYNGTNWTVVGK